MKSILLIILATIFLIGNFHVVTDGCSDLSIDESQKSFQSQAQHDPAADLCGHCGHMGLNVLFVDTTVTHNTLLILRNKPEIANFSQDSVFLAPPTPPPVIYS